MRSESGTPLGTTLIELLAALLVIGAALAAVAPAVPRPPQDLDSVEDRLRAVLAHARRSAAERGVTVIVELELVTGRYSVWMRTADGATRAMNRPAELDLPEGGRLVGARATRRARFRFGPLGLAHGDPLTLIDGEGRRRHLRVNRWTGRINATSR